MPKASIFDFFKNRIHIFEKIHMGISNLKLSKVKFGIGGGGGIHFFFFMFRTLYTSELQKVGTSLIFLFVDYFYLWNMFSNFTKRYVAANVSIKNSKNSLKFFLRCRFFLLQVSFLLSPERLRIRIFRRDLFGFQLDRSQIRCKHPDQVHNPSKGSDPELVFCG